jgi:hypothetical protein
MLHLSRSTLINRSMLLSTPVQRLGVLGHRYFTPQQVEEMRLMKQKPATYHQPAKPTPISGVAIERKVRSL